MTNNLPHSVGDGVAEWQKRLFEWAEGMSSMVVLGVGHELNADDAAAKLVVEALPGDGRIRGIWAGTVPESSFGAILRLRPSHVLVVDAAEFAGKPGEIRFFNLDEADLAPSTHSTPPTLWAAYLSDLRLRWGIIGIRPKSLRLLGEISPEVRRASQLVARALEALERANGLPGRVSVH